MKERGILFNGEMVRAILGGRKRRTRRVMKVQPSVEGQRLTTVVSTTFSKRDVGKHLWVTVVSKGRTANEGPLFSNPYGVIGDRLWVRETFAMPMTVLGAPNYLKMNDGVPIIYRADGTTLTDQPDFYGVHWRPSIHMPRWASRITLEITDVRVERVQDIGAYDALAEGIKPRGMDGVDIATNLIDDFRELWDSINAKRGFGWDANPWVWVIKFKRVDGEEA